MSDWTWPMPSVEILVPEGDNHPGAFGTSRLYDIHTGVDIYCGPGDVVIAVESGIVKGVEKFTGSIAGSPWWEDTDAVLVEGASGIVVYGEVISSVVVGQVIAAGDVVGNVKTVLKKDKGLPMTMLHLELYDKNMIETVWWKKDGEKPSELLNPTEFLKKSNNKL